MKEESIPVGDDWYKGKWEFWDVGRKKVWTVVTASKPEDFLRAVRPHLMSADIDFDYDPEINDGTVTVGGFRAVGKFRKVNSDG